MARVSGRGKREALSSRERRALRLFVRGYTVAEVADSLGLPVSDIELLHAKVCRKLDLGGRPILYEYAVAIGLVEPNGK